MAKKGELLEKNTSLLIAAQKKLHKNNFVQAKIDNTQQNSTCRLYLGLVWFGLIWFYGMSTIVGYLILNTFLYL